jgi:hypothetical protein
MEYRLLGRSGLKVSGARRPPVLTATIFFGRTGRGVHDLGASSHHILEAPQLSASHRAARQCIRSAIGSYNRLVWGFKRSGKWK